MTKIALIGSAPSSMFLAPYKAEDWQIWGCSPGALAIGKDADAWFELHRYEPGQPWFSPGYCEFLENFDGPVYMAEHVPSIKNCEVIPWRELVQIYGPYWFNSSLSWMMAAAIEEEAKTIGLWGVDMAAHEEYYSQKLGLIRFAEIAVGKGIEVGVTPCSDLFTPPPLYGICEITHPWIKANIRAMEIRQKMTEQERILEESKQIIQHCRGALDDLNWCQHTWLGNVPAQDIKYETPIMGDIMSVDKGRPEQYNNLFTIHDIKLKEADKMIDPPSITPEESDSDVSAG